MSMSDFDVDAGLRRFHLPTVRRMYPQLISEELAHRAETRIQRATRKARFPYLKTIEDFEFTFQTSIKRNAIGRYLGKPPSEWGRVLHDPALADAIIDRLLGTGALPQTPGSIAWCQPQRWGWNDEQ